MPGPQRVEVRGLTELRRELRKLEEPRTWTRELAGVHRDLARDIADKAQSTAASEGGAQRHFAAAIKGYGSAPAARIGIASAGKGQRNWGANAAFFGVKDNISGWNRSDTPNLKVPWVGASWDVAIGQGPQAIVDTIVRNETYIVDRYGDLIGGITRRAFPD